MSQEEATVKVGQVNRQRQVHNDNQGAATVSVHLVTKHFVSQNEAIDEGCFCVVHGRGTSVGHQCAYCEYTIDATLPITHAYVYTYYHIVVTAACVCFGNLAYML